MLKAMNTYKESLENAKDSFEAIVATGDLIMNMIEEGAPSQDIYDEAKEWAHGNATDFVIYLLSDIDSDMYEDINNLISSSTNIYFVDFEDALNSVLTLNLAAVNEALYSQYGLPARNLKIYASLFEYMNN